MKKQRKTPNFLNEEADRRLNRFFVKSTTVILYYLDNNYLVLDEQTPNALQALIMLKNFNMKVHIPKLNETYVCEVNGREFTNGHLDIYKRELADALQFGVQQLETEVWTY